MRIRFLVFVLASSLIGCTQSDQAAESPAAPATIPRNHVAPNAESANPLMPGMAAASFETLTSEDESFVFDSSVLERPAILVFYRGGWCPYCSMQLSELRKIDRQLADMGYDLLFLSADRPAKLREGSLGDDVPITLLSDSTMQIAQSYGIAFHVAESTLNRYLESGLDLAEEAGADHGILPVPSVFFVGSDGKINFQYSNPDYRVRISHELLLAAAEIFQEST